MKNVIESNKESLKHTFMKFGTTAILPGLSIIDPSYINHNPSTPDPIPGPEGLKPIILAMRNRYS